MQKLSVLVSSSDQLKPPQIKIPVNVAPPSASSGQMTTNSRPAFMPRSSLCRIPVFKSTNPRLVSSGPDLCPACFVRLYYDHSGDVETSAMETQNRYRRNIKYHRSGRGGIRINIRKTGGLEAKWLLARPDERLAGSFEVARVFWANQSFPETPLAARLSPCCIRSLIPCCGALVLSCWR